MSERDPGHRPRPPTLAQAGSWPREGVCAALLLGMLVSAPIARAEVSPAVVIRCADLDQDARAALEARALGILLVNGERGELSLECDGDLALAAWRSDTGRLKTLGEPRAALDGEGHAAMENTLEQLVDLAARLLPAPAAAGAASAGEMSASAALQGASPLEQTPPAEPPAAPLPSPFDALSVRPRPSSPSAAAAAPALRLGAAAEFWDGGMCCTAGFVLGAALPVSGDLRLGTSGSFELGLREVSGISVRHARFGVDLELQTTRWLALSGGAHVSALWVEATNVVAPGTLMSVQPVLALQAFARLPAGPHELAAGPVLRAYAKERELRVDGALVTRQPAFTVGLSVELRIRL